MGAVICCLIGVDPQAVWTIPIEDKTIAPCDFSYILFSTFYIFLPEWIHLYAWNFIFTQVSCKRFMMQQIRRLIS